MSQMKIFVYVCPQYGSAGVSKYCIDPYRRSYGQHMQCYKLGIERVQACTRWHFAFALCCHSNATRALIANLPNSARLGASLSTPPSYIWVRAVVWAANKSQTDSQTRVTTIHFASSTTHAKCNSIIMRVINDIIRPHHSTTYVDAAYCYRPRSVSCRSVCLSVCRSVCHTSETSKNGSTDRDAIWVEDSGGPREPRFRWGVQTPW